MVEGQFSLVNRAIHVENRLESSVKTMVIEFILGENNILTFTFSKI